MNKKKLPKVIRHTADDAYQSRSVTDTEHQEPAEHLFEEKELAADSGTASAASSGSKKASSRWAVGRDVSFMFLAGDSRPSSRPFASPIDTPGVCDCSIAWLTASATSPKRGDRLSLHTAGVDSARAPSCQSSRAGPGAVTSTSASCTNCRFRHLDAAKGPGRLVYVKGARVREVPWRQR